MRLIDADELLKHTCYIETGDLNGYEIIYPYEVKNAPTVDAVPVVRCKDCRYDGVCLTQSFVESESVIPFDRSTFYCADGERRTDEV